MIHREATAVDKKKRKGKRKKNAKGEGKTNSWEQSISGACCPGDASLRETTRIGGQGEGESREGEAISETF